MRKYIFLIGEFPGHGCRGAIYSVHGYWLLVFGGKEFGTSHTLGSDIARMGFKELATIPVVSIEAERIFSGSNLPCEQRLRLGDDIIEALECLKPWAREEVAFGAGAELDRWRRCRSIRRNVHWIWSCHRGCHGLGILRFLLNV